MIYERKTRETWGTLQSAYNNEQWGNEYATMRGSGSGETREEGRGNGFEEEEIGGGDGNDIWECNGVQNGGQGNGDLWKNTFEEI